MLQFRIWIACPGEEGVSGGKDEEGKGTDSAVSCALRLVQSTPIRVGLEECFA